MPYSLELDFVKPGKGDLPGRPHAHIYVNTHSTDPKRGLKFITPSCVSLHEFEHEINRLQKELEEIRKKAAKKFSTTK